MSVNRLPGRTFLSADPASPSRKSSRLQVKRQRTDEGPMAVVKGTLSKRLKAEDVNMVKEEVITEHEESTDLIVSSDEVMEHETTGFVSPGPQLLQSTTQSDTLKFINDHCITDLNKTPRATSTPLPVGNRQLRSVQNSGKLVQVVVKGEPNKALKVMRVAETSKPGSAVPMSASPQLQPLVLKSPGKAVQASQIPNLSPLRTDGSASPPKPAPVQINARVYASAEKTILLKQPSEETPTVLNSKDAVSLVTSMKSVLKSLDKHTFTEEVFECATAILKPTDAENFRMKPYLIQQVCGLTAISVVDIGISLFLFGPVERLHKAKFLIEMIKEKGYEKLGPQETRQFQCSSLQFIQNLQLVHQVKKTEKNPTPESLATSQAVQETEGVEAEGMDISNVVQPAEVEDEEDTVDGTYDATEEFQVEATENTDEQSLVNAMVDELVEFPSPIVKNEQDSFAESQSEDTTEDNVQAGDEVEYACDMCCVSFDSETVFQEHTAKPFHQAQYKQWADSYPYQCDQCLKRCKDPRAILIHQPQCSNAQLFRRIVNGRIVRRDLELETSNVIQLKRSQVEKWQSKNPDMAEEDLDHLVYDEDSTDGLKDCQDVDFDPDDNENDVEEVTKKRNRFLGRPGAKITCMHCDKVIMRSAFESHCIYNHSGWTYTCPLCPHQTNRRGAMQRHLMTRHKNDWAEGEVQVTIRGNISNTAVHTKVYMTGSHRNDYQCANCARTFADATELARHMFTQHVPKQFVCKWCGKHFGALHHLTFHSAAVHGRVMVADAKTGRYTVERGVDELHKRETLCNVCGEMYRSKVRHDKVCLKVGFKKKVVKTDHPDITQEMVDRFPESFKFIHECDQCGYKTTAKGLVSHKKFLHFNNSLYACSLCPLFANTVEIMEAHLKRKHFRSKQFREGLECTLLDEMPKDTDPEKGIVICVNSTCIRLPPSVKMEDYYSLLYNRKERIDNTTNAQCDECSFKGKAHIVTFHKKNVHGPVIDICPLCQKPMREDGILSRHIATEHFEDGTLVYSTRHATRTTREEMIKERSVLTDHEDTMVKCETCKKMIKSSYIRQHEKIHLKIANCEFCSASFRCKAELRKHLVRKHTPAELVCKQCDIGFQTTQDLENHIQLSHDNQNSYECPHCPNTSFETARYLKAHMLRKHENPHRFACPQCGKMFYEKCKRDQHMRIHLPDTAAGRYRAHCGVCNKSFKSERYLETHMNLHTKDTLYACSVCDRQFSLLSTLRKHQLMHSEERPFTCDHPGCNKQFKTVTKLKYHKVTHTKDSPYVCQTCDKVFTQPWTLKKHQCKFEKEGEQQQITTLFPQSPSTDSHDNLSMVLQQQSIMQAADIARGMDDASGEVVLDTAQGQVMLKQEPQEEHDPATTYQCGQCNAIMDTMDAAMKHVQMHHDPEEGGGAIDEQAPPTVDEFPPTSLPLVMAAEGAEQVGYEGAQQVQLEDLEGNQHYITLKLENAEEGEQVIQLDDNTFVLSNQQ